MHLAKYNPLVAVLLLIVFSSSEAFSITLYGDTEFRGDAVSLEVNRCTNVPMNDFAQSLKTSSCVVAFDDGCCQGPSVTLQRDSADLGDMKHRITSFAPCGEYRSSYPSSLAEKWLGHTQTVSKVWEDEDIALYYNSDMRRDVTWTRDYLKKLWAYVKRSYGQFGPEGSRLHPIFHANVFGSQYGFHSVQNYFDMASDCRNLIDVVGPSRDSWTGGPRGLDLDVLTHEVSHIVEFASQGVHGSPSYSLWGDSKWAEIFIYDVYSALGMNEERDRWFNQMQNSREDFPRPNTYWFKDWFYPVYQHHGGVRVLNKYFQLLSQYWPRHTRNHWQYGRDINLGEFVHFFSGAANTNLKPQAQIAFAWDAEAEQQLQRAKQEFNQIKY